MSIRLRLTLLYSLILTLTLVIFGIVLYSIQAQDTLDSLKRDLLLNSEKLVEAALRTNSSPPPRDAMRQEPPPPKAFDEFSSEQAFQSLREREIARILDENGNLLASPFGRAEDALPLSAAGFAALQNQQDWWENGVVSGKDMLIYSRPIVQNGKTIYIVQVACFLTERDRSLKSLATTLSGAALLTILLAFIAGWTLAGLGLRPIHRITQTAQAIGDERDFTRRVAYTGPQDEVGRLANTFNQMLTRLQGAYRQVEHTLQMQRNFVADVSHELRTPLTTLRGNLGLLRRKPPIPPEEQADILTDMVDESDRLIRLVNDLLLLARADAGRNLQQEPLELQPVLEETIRQAQQLAVERQIILTALPDLAILGDRDALKQIVLALLDNALKHSDGDIHIQTQRQAAQIEISVQDRGPGIAPDTLAHVFDRFYRGADSAATAGFGLGLPIARTLTEDMGGSISITSQLGQGSVVTLRFPAA